MVVWDTVSLEEILSSQKRILPSKKVGLALKLAVSLLQLKTSQWLCGTWSNQAVYFPKTVPMNKTHRVDIDQPLVLYSFSGSTQDILGEQKPRLMFLELGILLMEIWNEEALLTFARRVCDIEEIGRYQRESVAREWFDATSIKMTERYAKAVEVCLIFAFEYTRGVHTWDDDNLWKSVCAKTIGPLNEESGILSGK
jgi:hypothetical protein